MTDRAGAPSDVAAGDIGDAGDAGDADRAVAVAPVRRWDAVAAAFVAAAVLGGAARVWQTLGRGPLTWADTDDFLDTARQPWWSVDLWAGPRPAGVPALLKLVGRNVEAYADWQVALAVVCWAALAAAIVSVVAGRRRWVAGAAVVAFSLTAPVTMWDRSALSESPALSLLALAAAAGLQVARRPTAGWVAALAAATAAWLALRDSHASVVLLGGSAALAVVGASWAGGLLAARRGSGDGARAAAPVTGAVGADGIGSPSSSAGRDDGASDDASTVDRAAGGPGPTRSVPVGRRWLRANQNGPTGSGTVVDGGWRRPLAALGVIAVVLTLLVGWGSSHGRRHAFPMRNVYEVRVLPYPDRVEWFADHGMPQSEHFVGPDARAPYSEPGMPPVVPVGDDDPDLGPWLDWVASDGRAAFARYVATHPAYLVTEPLQSPERTFNNARGDREFYAAPDMRRVPLVDGALGWTTPVVLVVAAVVVGWAIGRLQWPPTLVVGMVLAALAVPHGLFAWHSDGMETARHLVVPAIQLRLGVLLMLVGAFTEPPPGRAGTGR